MFPARFIIDVKTLTDNASEPFGFACGSVYGHVSGRVAIPDLHRYGQCHNRCYVIAFLVDNVHWNLKFCSGQKLGYSVDLTNTSLQLNGVHLLIIIISSTFLNRSRH